MYRVVWWGTLSVNVLYILKTEQSWKDYPEMLRKVLMSGRGWNKLKIVADGGLCY
jgi:hypothetical protein